MKAVVHYSEIAIKGRNKSFFEDLLARNIEKSLKRKNAAAEKISVEDNRIVIGLKTSDQEKVKETLGNVFGIQNFAFAEETSAKQDDVIKKASEICKNLSKKRVALLTKISNERFPVKAVELNKKIEDEASKHGMKVDFENPEEKLSIEITSRNAYFYTKKFDGLGGLPVGCSGKVLVLLSGGIDSCVAAWLMMKRGCEVDYLHFHTFEENKEVLDTKINKIVEKLNTYGEKSRIFLIPYYNFQIATTGKMSDKVDVVVFKNFMLRIAERIAEKNGYDAVVTGDNLAQVASQTIDNIKATDHGINAEVMRPLLTYDKQEIINLAKKIGTYEESIKKYKDCCSIIAKHPDTSVKIEKLKNALNEMKIDELVNKSLSLCENFSI